MALEVSRRHDAVPRRAQQPAAAQQAGVAVRAWPGTLPRQVPGGKGGGSGRSDRGGSGLPPGPGLVLSTVLSRAVGLAVLFVVFVPAACGHGTQQPAQIR